MKSRVATPGLGRKQIMRSILLILALALGFCAAPAQAQQSPARQAFANEDLASDAIRLEEQLGKDAGALAQRPPIQLRKDAQQAIERGDFKTALRPLAALIKANPKDAAAWLAYSRAAIASGDTYDLQQIGASAAYVAYQRSSAKPEQAAALAWLGEIYARRRNVAALAQRLSRQPRSRRCRCGAQDL